MALTYSTMLALGTAAPDFLLTDTTSGKTLGFRELKSDKATVVMFICNHCPYVQHILDKLIEVTKTYQKKGISFIAISSNDALNYAADAPEKMKELAKTKAFSFPYLYDKTQEVAKAYHAACTPDFYVFDKALKCAYRGRFDGASPGNEVAVTGEDLCAALEAVLAGKPVNPEQKPSMGCNIKWKK